MPTITITNQVASQALRGENVKITVDLSSNQAEFDQLVVGQACVNNQSGAEGYVYSIDSFGNTFEITPLQPDFNMANNDAGNSGYFAANEDVIITL